MQSVDSSNSIPENMMDFTLKTYKNLLNTLQLQGYLFKTFEEFVVADNTQQTVVLRHDVDRLPENALKMARIENAMDIRASYFIRIVPQAWDSEIISEIVDLGHEVAYHYEDLTIAKGEYEIAIQHFEKQLSKLRKFYPSKTICMHGSPLSRWDNRKLWKKYDYRDYGIIAEPYFDVDYSKVFYITDTGRSWNNNSVSVRDTVNSHFDIKIKSTNHMINLIKTDKMPDKIMINTHPQRWFHPGYGWVKELVMQNTKNVIKRFIIRSG